MKVKSRRLALRFTENIGALLSALKILDKAPSGRMRWTPLVKRMYEVNTSLWQVHTMICWLHSEGYLHRPERGVYQLSPKGAALLAALSETDDQGDSQK